MSSLRERARRLRTIHHGPHPLAALRAGEPAQRIADEQGYRLAHVLGVQSFYDALHDIEVRPCVGTACWVSSGAPLSSPSGVHCRGRCFAPHASAEAPIPCTSLVPPIVLRHVLNPNDPRGQLADYALPTGEAILEAVERSGLRGRGGAAFATGRKWRVARDTPAPERVVVANGDEGDPGAYIDRLIMEQAPHSLLAGLRACAQAVGARIGVVFVRGEYPEAHRVLTQAVGEAGEHGWLGELHVEVVRGAGSYVAGEETALLRAIEGLRAEAAPKPPYPAERGLWGLPTVVQNIETLSLIPWVVSHAQRPDTKAVCLSGAVHKPGVVEVALGTPLRTVLEQGGGGRASARPWKMALVGGPMGCVIPEQRFDVTLDYGTLPGLGHAGVVVMDDTVSARALFRHLCAFAVSESCGSCTPCRVGSVQLGQVDGRERLERLLSTLELGSLCGFGLGVPRPIRDLLQHFGAELFA